MRVERRRASNVSRLQRNRSGAVVVWRPYSSEIGALCWVEGWPQIKANLKPNLEWERGWEPLLTGFEGSAAGGVRGTPLP
jgi:hypothetical protein